MAGVRQIRRQLAAARAAGLELDETARARKRRISLTLAHWQSCGRTFIPVPEALTGRQLPRGLVGMYANATYSVQIYDSFMDQGVWWLMVRRHDEGTNVGWYDLQNAKNQIMGSERLAVEVFPPESELVDQANIRHLWVYPPGHRLGFGL